MNVVHINARAVAGGAARACNRLHAGLREAGHASRVLTREPVPGSDEFFLARRDGPLWRMLAEMNIRAERWSGLNGLLAPQAWSVDRSHFDWADVVTLHNLHGYYFSLYLLPRIERRAPLVWMLSDMWALTGRCACPMDCEGWLSGCRPCPRPSAYPPARWDNSALAFRMKARIYRPVSYTHLRAHET